MRASSLTLLAAGLALSGCVAVPPGAAPPGYYPAPVAAAPAYPYQAGPAPGQPYVGPDGMTYVDGYPVELIDGAQVSLAFDPALGGWGYYDRGRRWRPAPPELRGRLEQFHPGGRGLPPPGVMRAGGRPGPARPGPPPRRPPPEKCRPGERC